MDVSIKVTKQQNLKQRPRKKGKLQLKSAKIKKNKKKTFQKKFRLHKKNPNTIFKKTTVYIVHSSQKSQYSTSVFINPS